MQALGLIETRGFLAAIECADIMLKTAHVKLVERIFTGGGLVTIIVSGDVGAVKAAVETGAEAVGKIGRLLLISRHIIPRPHDAIDNILGQSNAAAERMAEETAPIAANADPEPTSLKNFHKKEIDAFVQRFGLEHSINALGTLPVVKLRNLAREYKNLDIAGRGISKANKELLLQTLAGYYRKGE